MKKINSLEIGILNYFLIRAFFIGITFTSIIKITKQDSWIIPLMGITISIIYILLLNIILNYKPNLNLIQKINNLFNNFLGNIFTIIICIISIYFCIINFNNLTTFIHIQFLDKTPIIIISLFFIISIIYVLSQGINTIFKLCVLLFYISIILFLISLIGLIPNINFNNLKPFLQFNSKQLLNSNLLFYSFNITPIFLITVIPLDKIKKCKIKNTLILSSIFSIITLFWVSLITISTFGYDLSNLYEYPEFSVLKNISIFGLTSRIDSILVIQWLFDMYIYCVFIIYFIYKCISSLMKQKKINNTLFNYIFCIFLFIIIQFISNYNIYLENIILRYLAYPIAIIIITIILIMVIKIKKYKL